MKHTSFALVPDRGPLAARRRQAGNVIWDYGAQGRASAKVRSTLTLTWAVFTQRQDRLLFICMNNKVK